MNTVTGGVVSLALLGCIAGCAQSLPAASADHVNDSALAGVPALAHTSRATSRLGPPSLRGLGLRRVDRAASVGFTERY